MDALTRNRELVKKFSDTLAGKESATTELKVPAASAAKELVGQQLKILAGKVSKTTAGGNVVVTTKSGEKVQLKIEGYSRLWIPDAGNHELVASRELDSEKLSKSDMIVLFAEKGGENLVVEATTNIIASEIAPPSGGPPPIPVSTPPPPPPKTKTAPE